MAGEMRKEGHASSAWPADMIVMTRRPGLAICRMLLGSIPDKVMRMASCPVPAVHPAARLTVRDLAGPGSRAVAGFRLRAGAGGRGYVRRRGSALRSMSRGRL
jgi:hypothetical protein